MKYTKSFNGFKYTYSIDITLKKPEIVNLLFKKISGNPTKMLLNSLLKNKPTIFSKYIGEDIIHLGAQTFQIPAWVSYTIYKVSKSHIARPDLISRIMYGTDIYGDFICKVNGISNPFELNEGDVLIIPNLNNMGDFMMEDTYNDSLEESEDKPKPKLKKEKRKANEAVIGDTRFKIDKENHVIIY